MSNSLVKTRFNQQICGEILQPYTDLNQLAQRDFFIIFFIKTSKICRKTCYELFVKIIKGRYFYTKVEFAA